MVDPLTITDAAPLIKSGELTPSELLEQCLRRVDIYEHAIKAWVYLDRERARQDAARFTDEIKKGHYRGPLHGIPIGIKDIIDVFDMPTGCGSKLWANSYARKDATSVARLRQAGAVIMGKTVTTPYAYLDPPVTRNPWNLERTPGGSSSGSAAAVACAMCLGALGTQTGGSLTRPASYCGVCSLKPTYGRVSVEGVLPLAPSLDHVGVMARCVRDLAVIYEVIAGGNEQRVPDTFGIHFPKHDEPDYSKFWILDRSDDFASEKIEPEMDRAITSFFQLLTSEKPVANRTATITPNRLPPGFSEVWNHHSTIMSVEAAATHANRMARLPKDYPQKIMELVEAGSKKPAIDFALSQQYRTQLQNDLRTRFRFLFIPATLGAAPTLEATGSPIMNSPWSFAGVPTVSIPIHWIEGLPIACQIVSKNSWEDELLRVADWCEQVVAFPQQLPPIPKPG